MNLRRIFALVEADFKIMLRLKWKLVETFYFPISSILIWGFFTLWSREIAFEAAFSLLAINIFWNFASKVQSGTNQQIMEDRWTETIKQIIITPIEPYEYLLGKVAIGIIFSIASLFVTLSICYFFFDYSIILQRLDYFFIFAITVMFTSIAISIFVAAIITLLGNEYGFISWSTMSLLIVISAPFFPLSIYPPFIRVISEMVPYTWVFESIRHLTLYGNVPQNMIINGLLGSFVLLFLSLPIYSKSYEKARKTGKLVKIW